MDLGVVIKNCNNGNIKIETHANVRINLSFNCDTTFPKSTVINREK